LMAVPTKADDAAGSAELQEKVTKLEGEVAGIRADLKKLMGEIQSLKKAQAAARRPQKRRQRPAMQLLGKPAPEFTFKTTDDVERSLGGKSDKVKVAMFYATWCGFCKRALPGFDKLNKQYADQPVEIMAISLDSRGGKRGKTDEEIIANLEKLGVNIPLHMDPKKQIGSKYKVQSFPTSFVVGKNGVVEAVHVGGPKDLDKQIAAEVDKLLKGESLVSAKK